MILLKTNETNQTNKAIGLSSRKMFEVILTDHFSALAERETLVECLLFGRQNGVTILKVTWLFSTKLKKKDILFYCFFVSVK